MIERDNLVQWVQAQNLLNELAPLSRRDEWWETDGPREIIYRYLCEAHNEGVGDGRGY